MTTRRPPLPMKLHLHPMIAIGVNGCAEPHDNGRLHAVLHIGPRRCATEGDAIAQADRQRVGALLRRSLLVRLVAKVEDAVLGRLVALAQTFGRLHEINALGVRPAHRAERRLGDSHEGHPLAG